MPGSFSFSSGMWWQPPSVALRADPAELMTSTKIKRKPEENRETKKSRKTEQKKNQKKTEKQKKAEIHKRSKEKQEKLKNNDM